MKLKGVAKYIIDLGVDENQTTFHRTVTRTINIMSLINIGVGLIANPVIYFSTGIKTVLLPSFGEDLLFVLVLYMNKRRWYDQAAFIMYVTHCASILYFGAKFGVNAHAEILTLYLLVAAYLVFKTNTFRIVAMLMSIMTFILLEMNFQNHYIPEWQISASNISFIRWMIYGSVATLGGSLMFFFIQRSAQQARLTEMEIASKTEKYLKAVQANELLLNAKELLLNEVTHEISNPAHIIVNTARKYEQRVDNISDISRVDISLEDLRRLVTAGSTIADQCTTILSWAQNEREGVQQITNDVVGVYSWATNLINLYQHKANERQIDLTLSINENTPEYIVTDRIKVNHIVTNLLINAIKFTFKDTKINITIFRLDSNLIIEVKDFGPGIPEEKQNKIFEAYYTSGESKAGIMSTGVGLALAKKLTHQLDGSLTLQSKIGVGTTFKVCLPLVIPSAIELKKHLSLANCKFNGQKILVVDDDKMCRLLCTLALKRFGCVSIEAKTPEEAIDIATKEAPDVILLDMNLSGEKAGNNIVKCLKENKLTANIPIIIVSAGSPEAVRECIDLGADAYLHKPFLDVELIHKLESFLPLMQIG